MSKYLDSKVDEIMNISLMMKRYFQHNYMNIVEGLTTLQIETLMHINNHPKISMREIGEHLKVSMSSATQLVERLVGNQLVIRLLDESDRRIIRLDLSEIGKKEIAHKHDCMKNKIKELYSVLTDAEIKEHLIIMKKLFAETLKH